MNLKNSRTRRLVIPVLCVWVAGCLDVRAAVPASGGPAAEAASQAGAAEVASQAGAAEAASQAAAAAAVAAAQVPKAGRKLPTGLAVSKRLLRFLRAVDPTPKYRVVSTEKRPFAWHVTYEVAAGRGEPKKRGAFVSMDGRYMSNEVVDIVQRIASVEEDEAIAQCLYEKGVKVFVDPAESESRRQLDELRLAASYVVIDCGGERRALCKRLGHETFPAAIWPDGGEVGVRRLDWLRLKVGCQ